MKRFAHERLLGRMLFRRFFESDLLPPGLPQVQLLIWGVASLTAPGYLMACFFAIKYDPQRPAELVDVVLGHELLFVTFGMFALGAVALIIWEGVFPDRRDVRILGVLPLSTRTHVLARVGALGAVAGLFCLGVNLPAAVVYGLALWGKEIAPGPLRAVAAHLIATSAGGVFTFFLVIGAQGLLLTLYGRRTARALALVLQVLLVIVLLQAAVFLSRFSEVVQGAFVSGDGILAALPPAWFLALYNVLAGTSRPGPAGYTLAAVGLTLLAVAVATTLVAARYSRLMRMALETAEGPAQSRRRWPGKLLNAVTGLVARSPVARAVAMFTLVTLARSRTHLTLLATYAGVAAAVVLSTVVPLVGRDGLMALAAPSVAALSLPLVVNFVMLGGLRVLVALPTEIKANWAFRLYAPDDRLVAAISGVRAAFLLAVVGPVAVASAVGGVLLWGVGPGLLHGLFTGAAGLVLVDVLMVGLRKIPFTCTYSPGRSGARTMWPFYAMAFALYAYWLAALEVGLLGRPRFLGILLAIVAAACTGFAVLRRQLLQSPPGLTYSEEDRDGLFGGFGLSEGLAATRPGGLSPAAAEGSDQPRSTASATPLPPPRHNAAMPRRTSRRFIS